MKNIDYKQITFLQAHLLSANLGDKIISEYCEKWLRSCFPNCLVNYIPTQMKLDSRAKNILNWSNYAFVCGTNLISGNMHSMKQWNIHLYDCLQKTKFILCGVGWWQYQNGVGPYSKMLLKGCLDRDILHSVRDEYTKKKLQEAGITNVLNTGCPTMWALTPEFCETIPKKKSSQVITTLTDYMRDPQKDKAMLELLIKEYKKVYFWVQNDQDYVYVSSLVDVDKLQIVPPVLGAYDKVLGQGNIDYVGTRLHGGVRALNYRCRSIILSIDNRATEIARDTNLMVVPRGNIHQLQELINGEWATEIHIPVESIEKWKKQFIV